MQTASPRRWSALALIALAQFMVIMDTSIIGVALPDIRADLGVAPGDLVAFQQMGFGVAIALLVDATIVRTVIIPAVMQLLGERNWYLPEQLAWLPNVHIEGEAAAPPPVGRHDAPARPDPPRGRHADTRP